MLKYWYCRILFTHLFVSTITSHYG